MIPVAELQSMLDTLDRAIFSGARRVQFTDGATGRLVEYNSMDEMRKARADLVAQIQAAGNSTPSSFSLATHSRD
jgi:roadblock/LC7 domain-containing protein